MLLQVRAEGDKDVVKFGGKERHRIAVRSQCGPKK